MKVDKKLIVFNKIASRDAEEKRARLLAEIDAQRERAYADIRERAQTKADALVAGERQSAEQKIDREKLNASLSARKSLAELRERLLNELFEGAMGKLMSFVESEKYMSCLVEKASAVCKEFGGEIEIWLCPRDMSAASKIQEICPGVKILEGEKAMLGGFKAMDNKRGITYNFSLGEKFTRARESFKGLKIYD